MELHLRLPQHCIEIEQEELMYLDGGNGWWNSTGFIGVIIDAGLMAIGIWSSAGKAAIDKLKACATTAVNYLRNRFGLGSAFAGKVLATIFGLGSILGASIGYFAALAIDGADGWFGGKSWNGYCFG